MDFFSSRLFGGLEVSEARECRFQARQSGGSGVSGHMGFQAEYLQDESCAENACGYDYILTKHSIEFKAAWAGFHPQLVAIAESTFNALLMLGGGDFNPEFRDNLLIVPFTLLKIKLT